MGYGTLTWPSGAKYIGEWKNGLQHGIGTYITPQGVSKVGEYHRGAIRRRISD